jgi:N-formylglutamate deformylase
MPNHTATPWVVVTPPAAPEAPLVFDSPHSGIRYPADFRPAASPAAILTTWDAFVDELFAGVTAAGATLVAADFPRAYIDANRAATDIDSDLLEEPWPEATQLSEQATRGMGLIRRLALPGVPMYARKLSVAEVRRRIEEYYLPYRAALNAAVEAAVTRHGFVWHFNCHSMKSRGNAMNRDFGVARPDFVIGDRGGTSAPPEFTGWVAAWFRQRGHEVAINEPYRGADIVRTHGEPARRRYSVQIEINRALYLEEATCQRGPRFASLCGELAEFAQAAAARARAGG